MLKKLFLSSIIALSIFTTTFANMININQADITTLAENLKGIGIKKAKAIVDYRKENGNFNTIDDLTKVKGIGPKTLEKNRAFISIGESKKTETKTTEEKKEVNKKQKNNTSKNEE